MGLSGLNWVVDIVDAVFAAGAVVVGDMPLGSVGGGGIALLVGVPSGDPPVSVMTSSSFTGP